MRDGLNLTGADSSAITKDAIETKLARAAEGRCTYLETRTAQSLVRVKDSIFVCRLPSEAAAQKWCDERGVTFIPFWDLTATDRTRILFS